MNDAEFSKILRHDLHKVRVGDYESHSTALNGEPLMQKADGIAARMSRKSLRVAFVSPEDILRKPILSIPKRGKIDPLKDVEELFRETDPITLHEKMLNSRALGWYVEAIEYPFTSLKAHVLLVCALYYSLKQENEWFDLYLAENVKPESEFQVIFRSPRREWSILPTEGMSRVRAEFSETWSHRTQESIGGEDPHIGALLERVHSWSTALALVEDAQYAHNISKRPVTGKYK